MKLRIEQISIYPVKGLRGIQVTTIGVTPLGLDHDRQWMLVDSKGKFISQRSHPELALFSCEIKDDKLVVHHKNSSLSITAALQSAEDEKIEVEVWNSSLLAGRYQNEVNQWFSDRLNSDVQLVSYEKFSERSKHKEFGTLNLRFTDGYPILLCSNASLDDLNSRLDAEIQMNRFRPNLSVSGIPAWSEFKIKHITCGENRIHFAKPCERCSVTGVDQETAIRQGKEPLRTLVDMHGAPALFGANMYTEQAFTLAVGQEFEVD